MHRKGTQTPIESHMNELWRGMLPHISKHLHYMIKAQKRIEDLLHLKDSGRRGSRPSHPHPKKR